MRLIIIDYGAGNIKSLQFAFKRLGIEAQLSHDKETISNAERVIFPGVGEASSAMAKLRASGLHSLIPELKQPVLGICLGMQLMCNSSSENNTKGLGIFDTDVIKFDAEESNVPQIGWNTINSLSTPLFKNIKEDSYIYGVHSYYAPACNETIATSHYQLPYSAALHKDNFYGVQFHPEKSAADGAQILKNFIELKN